MVGWGGVEEVRRLFSPPHPPGLRVANLSERDLSHLQRGLGQLGRRGT